MARAKTDWMQKLLMMIGSGLLLIGPLHSWSAPGHAAAGAVERLTATAAFVSKPGMRPSAVTLEILIDRWSTDAERDRLIETLKDQGPNALLDLLRSLPSVGHISTTTSTGSSLRFAQSKPAEDGGRHIILAAERPVGVGNQQPRGRRHDDYPITALDIRFDRDGSGEGKLAYAARLTHNRKTGTIEVENYANEAITLTSVRSVR
jgi:hypothetical protein